MPQLNNIGNAKPKEIQTNFLTIKGNIIECNDLLIQMSNVSTFEAINAPTEPFPTWTIILGIISLACLSHFLLVGIIGIAITVYSIFKWYKTNEELKQHRYLIITLNSRDVIRILFTDIKFLQKVLSCIEEILINPESKLTYHINIQGNTISGGSSAIDSLQLK